LYRCPVHPVERKPIAIARTWRLGEKHGLISAAAAVMARHIFRGAMQ
jgi:hypothetical protein